MERNLFGLKALFVALAIATGLVPSAVLAADAPSPAEAFVQKLTDDGIRILQDKTNSPAQRRQKVSELLNSVVDTDRIALFALGRWKKTASKADLDAFAAAFHDFTLATYGSRLNQYSGETLKLTGSVARTDTDFIVSATLIDPADPSDKSSTVDFRVLDSAGKFSVVDFSLLGVWFGLGMRDDFSSYLGKNNGDIAALTERLKQSTEKLRAK